MTNHLSNLKFPKLETDRAGLRRSGAFHNATAELRKSRRVTYFEIQSGLSASAMNARIAATLGAPIFVN